MGQKVYVCGRRQAHPSDPSIVDVVAYSVSVLEQLEVPVLVPGDWDGDWDADMSVYFEDLARRAAKKLKAAELPVGASDLDSTRSWSSGDRSERHEGSTDAAGYMPMLVEQDRVLLVDGPEPLARMSLELASLLASVDEDAALGQGRDGAGGLFGSVAVGLDCEWQPDRNKAVEGARRHAPVSLLQLATSDSVYVIDLLTLCTATPGSPPPQVTDAVIVLVTRLLCIYMNDYTIALHILHRIHWCLNYFLSFSPVRH